MTATPAHRVLVPVDLFGGQAVPERIIEAFASVPVVLLGYHQVPDQTTPDQARTEFGDQAQTELAKLEQVFEAAGCAVTTRLVFTGDRLETFERVAIEQDCDSILLLNPAPVLERMLVAIRSDVNVEHIARLVTTVCAGTTIDVTLFHVADEESRAEGQHYLETAASELVENGLDSNRIETRVVSGRPTDAILTAAADHDLLVIGESRPSIRRRIFSDRARRIARQTNDPVLVIRGEYIEPTTENPEVELATSQSP